MGGTKKLENATHAIEESHTRGTDHSQQAAENLVSPDVDIGGLEAVEATEKVVDDGNDDDNGDDDETEEEHVNGRIEKDEAAKRVSD